MQQRAHPRGRGIVAVAAVCAVLTVVACSATGPVAANTSAAPAVTGPKAVTSPAAPAASSGTIPGCRVGVWAEKVTDAGRVDWQVSLPFDASLGFGSQSPPLAVGGLSLFAVGDTLYALRLSDGRQVWHWGLPAPESPRPGVVAGKTVNTVDVLWTWHGSVIALADAATPSLVSLNPATGAVRWRAGLGPAALRFGTVWLSSDGVAAAVTGTRGHTLTAIDLATGRRLWSRTFPNTPVPVADGTTFVLAVNAAGTLVGLRARTGATQWSRTGFPGHMDILAAPGGPVLVYGIAGPLTKPVPGGPATLPVHRLIALSAATGCGRRAASSSSPATSAAAPPMSGIPGPGWPWSASRRAGSAGRPPNSPTRTTPR
jgi:putative pyrroloquinoline-quinone binding quinoprotein